MTGFAYVKAFLSYVALGMVATYACVAVVACGAYTGVVAPSVPEVTVRCLVGQAFACQSGTKVQDCAARATIVCQSVPYDQMVRLWPGLSVLDAGAE